MEQRMISKTNEQCTFLIKDTNIEFYLVIPNSRQLNILISLYKDVNDGMIAKLPVEQDKAIVVPVINNQILTNANLLDVTSLKYLDGVLSYLINTSYKILTYNHLEVSNKILLNNNPSLANFNKQYASNYQGRVELYTRPLPQSQAPIQDIPPVPQPNVPNDNVTPTTAPDEDQQDLMEKRDPGFVSYVLLGVLVAVISLVFLYLIL